MSVIKGISSTSKKPVDVSVDDQGRLIISNPGSGGGGGTPITGFSTEDTLQQVLNKLPTLSAGRIPVTLNTPVPVQIDTSTPLNVGVTGTIALPTGASTEATLVEV